MPWPNQDGYSVREEAHFGTRVSRCYSERLGSIGALLAGVDPASEALVEGSRRVTHGELADQIRRVAANMAALGVAPGDRVAILLANRVEFVVTLLAAERVGAIAVPLNVREQHDELVYVLADSGARMLVHEADLADRLPTVAEMPKLVHRFSVGGSVAGSREFGDLLADGAPEPPVHAVDEEETAIILYTSGTTGQPKGAMIAHVNMVHSVMHYTHCLGLAAGERAMLVVPASHITGLAGILLPILGSGGCVILQSEFKVESFLATAAAERMTHTILVPAMYNLCILRSEPGEYDLSAWRVGLYGGAPMPEATIMALAERLPNLQLGNAYGSTETTSPTTIMPYRDTARHADSVGRVVPCAEILIMDEDGRAVPDGETGEVWIKGPMVVRGYWNKPEETAENFVGGYWRSGDIGMMRDGFLHVRDRLKDMINRGGYKIFSAEVENVLTYHPDVAEVAVVGRPDPVLGERAHCFVVPKGSSVDTKSVRDFAAERLSDYKVPEGFTVIDHALPRNANGKVLKRLLAVRARFEAEGDV
ncbi:MAG: AMP-binding protein [Rhodospirillaceae bacterium]|jgi:long-chain acyl-CoA synthetase|nr:AMP-binding protein [Rhodospirillaceae bacterium]MBT6140061.1 AMP-binding protein [Rhodospirillaceae bacterium]